MENNKRKLFKYNGIFKEVKDLESESDLKLDEIYNSSGDLYVFRGCESQAKIIKSKASKYPDGIYYDNNTDEFITKGEPIGKLSECIEQPIQPDINQLLDNLKILQNKVKKEKEEKLKKEKETFDVSILAKKTKVATYGEKGSRMNKEAALKFNIVDEDELPVQIIKSYINSHNIFYRDIEKYFLKNGKTGNEYNLYYGLKERHTMAFSTFQTWCDLLNLDINLSVTEK